MVKSKGKDLKVVERCCSCQKPLPKFSKHHKRCHKCWEKRQLEMGNLALLSGVK